MKIDLSGQTALVTGGFRGIGRAITEALVECGATVIATYRDEPPTSHFGLHVEPVRTDFSRKDELVRIAQSISTRRIDILVNNAGINTHARVGELDLEVFEQIMQVNLYGAVTLCNVIAPEMAERGYGRIVNITSIFSHVSKERRAPYTTSKFALLGFTRTMALDYASTGVLANCVGPGFIATEMTERMLGTEGIREMTAVVPMQRLGKPEEVGRLVAFLASPLNTFMTGQNLILDGGFTCT